MKRFLEGEGAEAAAMSSQAFRDLIEAEVKRGTRWPRRPTSAPIRTGKRIARMSAQTPAIELMKLISGFQVSQAISVAAALGIADILKDRSLPCDEIAATTGCHPRSLYRLLHMLASAGVFEELPDQHFRLSPVGDCLRSDSPHARSAWARYVGRPYVWQSWGEMLQSVRTGKSAFSQLHGENCGNGAANGRPRPKSSTRR